jgi:uncharacterized tellurite resistance protein B-like protein
MASLQDRPDSLALRSYARLSDACTTLSDEGGWRKPEEISAALARSVLWIFFRIANADNRLDESERRLLADLCRLDATYRGNLSDALRGVPRDFAETALRDILEASMEFDRREGTSLAREIVDAVESLAYAVIGSDGTIALEELEALGEWIGGLYAILGEGTPAQDGELATLGT